MITITNCVSKHVSEEITLTEPCVLLHNTKALINVAFHKIFVR